MDASSLAWIIPVVVVGIVALAVGPMLVRLFRNRRMTKEVLRIGVEATATITRTWDTGVRINDNPQVGMQLSVQPPGGMPFHAEVTQTVSIVQLPAFQPGSQLQVKFDPANPSRVAIVGLIGGLAGTGAPVAGVMNAQQAEQMLTLYQAANAELLKTGMPAPARVLQYLPMGINVNGNNPAVILIVEVHPNGGPAFTAQSQGNVVWEANIYKYQPGQMVTVRYNPNDLTRVAVERSGV